MEAREIINWENTNSGKVYVAEEFFHHHAFEILNTHHVLRDSLKQSLSSDVFIETRIKKTKAKKTKAIKADVLNVELRKLLKGIPKNEIKFEVSEEHGVFYFSAEKSSIGGFDFAILNHHKNLAALRNLCFGELHYHKGEERWKKFLQKNDDLVAIAKALEKRASLGENVDYSKTNTDTPLIVGEIQFGNWALAYRDFFKVLKADVQNSIDCLVYVVPTGNLEYMLSDGIVTYDKTVKILKDFEKVISVPVWVIGLDMK